MNSRKITIGMPVYNSEKTLKKSINSILNQTYKNIDIVISDNASTDETESICRNFCLENSNIKYIRQPKNAGPLANFTFTLKMADTEYFMWASGDDLWHPTYIEKCINALDKNSDAGFAVTKWQVESARLPFIKRWNLANMEFVTNSDPITRMLSFTSLPFTSFKDNITYSVWRRDVIKRVADDLHGKIKYFSVGSVANEYSLLISKGVYVLDTYMRKRYEWLPPGHLIGRAISSIFCIFQLKRNCSSAVYSADDHFADLTLALNLAGVNVDVIKKAIELNKKYVLN